MATKPITEKATRGDTYRRGWRFTDADTANPVDLTGAAALLQWRNQDDALILEATVANGRLTMDIPTATIALNVECADMATMPLGITNYDLEITLSTGYRFTPVWVQSTIVEDYSRHG